MATQAQSLSTGRPKRACDIFAKIATLLVTYYGREKGRIQLARSPRWTSSALPRYLDHRTGPVIRRGPGDLQCPGSKNRKPAEPPPDIQQLVIVRNTFAPSCIS